MQPHGVRCSYIRKRLGTFLLYSVTWVMQRQPSHAEYLHNAFLEFEGETHFACCASGISPDEIELCLLDHIS